MDSSARPHRSDLLGLALVSLAIFLIGLGSGSLRDTDEAIYAQVAREYFERGDWLSPTWNFGPWFHKPPLMMWLTAIGYGVLGVGEGAARLGSALCATGLVLATYAFCARAVSRAAALVAVLMLLSTEHFLALSKTGMLDVPLTFFVSVCLYAWWEGLSDPRWFVVCGAAFGLAIMTKGAAAGIVPLILGSHTLLSRRWSVLRSPQLWAGLLVALAIAMPWHALQASRHGERFWNEYFFYHVYERAAAPIEGHTGGALYYLDILLDKQRPWIVLALAAIPWLGLRAWRQPRDVSLLLLCWIVVVLGLYTVVRTKLSWYILPIYPALCIVFASFLVAFVPARHARKLIAAAALMVAAKALFTKRVRDLDWNPDAKAIGPSIQRTLAPDETLVLLERVGPPSALFYGQRRVVTKSPSELSKPHPTSGVSGDVVVLARAEDVSSLQAQRPAGSTEILDQRGKLVLLRLAPTSAEPGP